MVKTLSKIPESLRSCPICETEGEVVRIIKYGSEQSEEQIKLQCPECSHTWLYHTDD